MPRNGLDHNAIYAKAMEEAVREVSYLYPADIGPWLSLKIKEIAHKKYIAMVTPPKRHVSNEEIMDKLKEIEQKIDA